MNTHAIKKDFPIFSKRPQLIYLDSAATSLTPQCVIDRMTEYYTLYNANIARGTYEIGALATEYFETSRTKIAQFIGAHPDEVIFTSGATMSLNMIAHGLAHTIDLNDSIVTTKAEHHANFIPWQQLCKNHNAHFKTVDISDDGTIDTNTLLAAINSTTKIVALTHVSNVFGAINPLIEIIKKIRNKNSSTMIVIDAAQSVAHLPIDVQQLDCDFLAFSLHKLYGPTGVGILYGKKSQLEKLEPLFTGGEMICEVSSQNTTFRELPHRLEAGTPNIANVIASAAAISYIEQIGFDVIRAHDMQLTTYCTEQLTKTFGNAITIYGPQPPQNRSGIISFTFKNYHPHDIASIADSEKSIALRAGQHCAMPLHREILHVNATARASFGLYNTTEDIDQLIEALRVVEHILTKK